MSFLSLEMSRLLNSKHQYALTAMRNLMDYDYGWATIETPFIAQVSGATRFILTITDDRRL